MRFLCRIGIHYYLPDLLDSDWRNLPWECCHCGKTKHVWLLW